MDIYVIAGLGNPGKEYAQTRHNLGFITVDQLAEKIGVRIERSKFKSLVGEGNIADRKVLLLKPQTYMNNSGEAIREVMDYYKLDPGNLMVIYDDIDIPLGHIRIRSKGSGGTHNGMRSIIQNLSTDEFPRIRIGIGGERGADLVDYVLGGFRKSEVEPLEEACIEAVNACICYVEHGIEKSMSTFNKKVSEDKEAKESKESEE